MFDSHIRGIWNRSCPVADNNPTVMQACSRSGRCAFRAKFFLEPTCKQNVWCKMRRHAMWKSRWGTYLKLCRTKWDRKWDSQLMVLLSSPLPSYYLQHCCPLMTHANHCANISKCMFTYVHVASRFWILLLNSSGENWQEICWVAVFR